MTWQPTTIRRFVAGFPTSACTALVVTDVGRGYLKAMGGPEGEHTLASEVVGTQLAEWLGLPTFDWAILNVDEIDEIPFVDKNGNPTGQATSGPAFITRAEDGTPWGGSDRELKRLENPEDISRLVVFDTWVLNCDRHSRPLDNPTGRVRIKRDNVFFSEEAEKGHFVLKAMDHTHCFTCGSEWTRRLSNVDKVKDGRVFGLFPEFRDFLNREAVAQAASDVQQIDQTTVREFTDRIPNEWDVTQGALDALVDLVVQRAKFVARTIEDKLWPQQEIDWDDGNEGE